MNSLERLSTALESYVLQITYSQPRTQAVVEETQFWDDVDIVQFSVKIDELFEECKQITALKAKFIRDGNGNTNFDAYALTNDERCWFEKTLLEGSKKVFNRINHLAKDVVVPFLYDEGVTVTDFVPANTYPSGTYVRDNVNGINIYLSIQDVPEESSLTDEDYWEPQSVLIDTKGKVVYNITNDWNTPDAAFTGMNNNIRAALKFYCLAEWYRLTGILLEAQTFDIKVTEELTLLIRNSHQRIRSISRTYDPAP